MPRRTGRMLVTRRAEAALMTTMLLLAGAASASARGYELVSPTDDGAYDAGGAHSSVVPLVPVTPNIQQTTPGGDHAVFNTSVNGTLPGMAVDGDAFDYFVAARGDQGWDWTAPLGDRTDCGPSVAPQFNQLGDAGGTVLLDILCPREKAIFGGSDPVSGEPLDQVGSATGQSNPSLYRVDVATDTPDYVSGKFGADGAVPRTDNAISDFLGGSPDLSTVYVATFGGLLPGIPDGGSGSGRYLYKVTDGRPTLLSRETAGTPLIVSDSGGSGYPNPLDRPYTVSQDGAAITFTSNRSMVAEDDGSRSSVYQIRDGEVSWITDPDAVPLANRPPTQTRTQKAFQAASADGTKVFFSTTERMTADDADSGADQVQNTDIYVYDGDEPADARISRISVKDPACGDCDDNLSTTTPAQSHSNAKFVTASADGSRAFFITGDRLAADDGDAQQSLYTHDLDTGLTSYVAPAGAGVTAATNGTDAGTNTVPSLTASNTNARYGTRPIKVTPDGSTAAFLLATNVNLPLGSGGPDVDGTRDLFVWQEDSGLRRVPQGTIADANTLTMPTLGCMRPGSGFVAGPCRTLSDDGAKLYFTTTDTLVAADEDVDKVDVYEYATSDGAVQLVSPQGSFPFDTTYVDNSVSGDTVFFETRETLDPSRDTDRGRIDVYAARTGSVFGPLPSPSPGCTGDSCQPDGPASPGAPPARSQDTVPADNVAPRTRVRPSMRLLRPSRRAVRRMGRTGRLPLRVQLTGGGTIRVNARARVRVRVGGRIGVRSRRVAATRRTVRRESTTTVRLPVRLNGKAKRQLRRNGKLGVRIRVLVSGLGRRGLRVVPRRPSQRARSEAKRASVKYYVGSRG